MLNVCLGQTCNDSTRAWSDVPAHQAEMKVVVYLQGGIMHGQHAPCKHGICPLPDLVQTMMLDVCEACSHIHSRLA